uniref:TB domain-containing protein n=1 Tax=Cyprinus carpio TaxID=7962 RepID=A0A8C2FHB9_CYPCA
GLTRQLHVLCLGHWLQTLIRLALFFSTAGNCWLQQGKNGRCQVLYMPGMSREECCRSGRLGTSWTEEDVPNSTLFRWMIFNETCDNVDCGPGKK